MKWVAVTQWVRTARGKSHLTNAQPAGQECTPRAPPVMGVRRWRERGSRPREGAPTEGKSWSTGASSRCRAGKADGGPWPEGRSPGGAKARVQDTTGGCERGLLAPGGLGHVGEPMVALGQSRRRRAARRGADARRGEEASASHTRLVPARATPPEACPKGSGQAREHRTPPRGALGSRRGASYRRPGAGRSWSGRWGPEVPGPPGRAGDAGPHVCWEDLWERRRAHPPSPGNSRAWPHRPSALRRWCATPCVTCLTGRACGKPSDRPVQAVHRGWTR